MGEVVSGEAVSGQQCLELSEAPLVAHFFYSLLVHHFALFSHHYPISHAHIFCQFHALWLVVLGVKPYAIRSLVECDLSAPHVHICIEH